MEGYFRDARNPGGLMKGSDHVHVGLAGHEGLSDIPRQNKGELTLADLREPGILVRELPRRIFPEIGDVYLAGIVEAGVHPGDLRLLPVEAEGGVAADEVDFGADRIAAAGQRDGPGRGRSVKRIRALSGDQVGAVVAGRPPSVTFCVVTSSLPVRLRARPFPSNGTTQRFVF